MAVIPERRPRHVARPLIAASIASALIGGSSMVLASAADENASFAKGRFLSGSIAGFDLDQIAELHGAEAAHSGEGDPVSEGNPLELDVLGTKLVDIDGGIQIPTLGSALELGAVNQYATAGPAGVAGAGSGAVADNGAIGTGVPPDYPATGTLHLTELLGDQLTGSVANVDLYVEAVTATAKVAAAEGASSTDYEIAGLYLELGLPVLSNLLSGLTLGSVTGSDDCVIGDGTFLEIDTCRAVVIVDLYELTDGTLNDMSPNTEVLSDEVLGELTSRITDHVGTLLDDILGGGGSVEALTSDLTGQLTPVLAGLNDILSIQVNVQGEERQTAAADLGEALNLQGAGAVNAGLLPAQAQPESTNCETAGVTALQVEVLKGNAAVVNLASADAKGCFTTDDGGDANGDEGGDADGGDVDGGDADGDEGGDDGDAAGAGDEGGDAELPDTGAGSGWLLPAGLVLVLGGGATIYLMNRRTV